MIDDDKPSEPKGTPSESNGTPSEPKGTPSEPKGTPSEPKGTPSEPKGKLLHFPVRTKAAIHSVNSMMLEIMREYKLVGHEAVRITDPTEAGTWIHERYRIIDETGEDPYRVAFTDLGGGVSISTVFVGIDLNFMPKGPPLIFETMVFGHDMLDLECRRCSTWQQAEEQHQAMLAMIRMCSTG